MRLVQVVSESLARDNVLICELNSLSRLHTDLSILDLILVAVNLDGFHPHTLLRYSLIILDGGLRRIVLIFVIVDDLVLIDQLAFQFHFHFMAHHIDFRGVDIRVHILTLSDGRFTLDMLSLEIFRHSRLAVRHVDLECRISCLSIQHEFLLLGLLLWHTTVLLPDGVSLVS